jgi:hypothetical protein
MALVANKPAARAPWRQTGLGFGLEFGFEFGF